MAEYDENEESKIKQVMDDFMRAYLKGVAGETGSANGDAPPPPEAPSLPEPQIAPDPPSPVASADTQTDPPIET